MANCTRQGISNLVGITNIILKDNSSYCKKRKIQKEEQLFLNVLKYPPEIDLEIS